MAENHATSCLVAGDYNCTRECVERALPGVSVHEAKAPTRLGKSSAEHAIVAQETIDHTLVFGAPRALAVVRVHETDVHALSDHRPVSFVFE